jgi:hypothetical protein
VATSFSFDQTFAADPATVLAMLRNPDYVRLKGESTGGHDVQADVTEGADGTLVITSTRTMPANVPSYAQPFVGESITVTEVQTWTPLSPEGRASATVTVDFHAPLSYTGAITLEPGGEGTVLHNTGSFKANVPFVGGKVENVAREQTERYLAKEATVGAQWLAR